MGYFEERMKSLGLDAPEKKEKKESAPKAAATGGNGTVQANTSSGDYLTDRMKRLGLDYSGVDDSYISRFQTDANSFLDGVKGDFDRLKSGTDYSYRDSWKEKAEDLSSRKWAISQYLKRNRDTLAPDQYQKALAHLEEIGKAVSDSYSAFRSANDEFKKMYGSSAETFDIMGAEDFRESSQYTSTRSDDWWERAWSQYSMGYNDLTYEYINNQEGIRDEINSKSRAFNSDVFEGSAFEKKHYDYMTADEVSVYNYYYARDGKKRAEEYLDSIGATLEARANRQTVGNVSEFADAHPVLASALSVGTSLGSGGEYIRDVLTYGAEKLQGRDTRLGTNEATLMTNAVRSTVSEKVDWEIKGWDAFDFLYSTAMSGADSLASGLMFGGYGGAVLGLSAAAQATNDALDRGMSDGQAFWNGLFSGVFEGLFESVSIGNFQKLKEVAPDSVKDIIKNLGKSMLVNASEETLTELANITYDTMINGEFANYTWEELKAGAWKDALQQVIEAGASGALMGVGMSGAGNSIAYSKANHEAKQNYGEFQHDLVGEALEIDPENAYAKQMQERLDGGKDLRGSQLRKLVRQNDAAIAAQGDTAGDLRAEEYGRMLDAAENGQDGAAGKKSGEIKTITLEEVSGKYGAQAQAMVKTFQEGQDVARYDAAYKNAYDMGKSGVSLEYAKNSQSTAYLTEEQVELAYEAGTAAQNSFEASGEGKTLLQKDGSTIRIQGVESVSGGSMTLKLEDGRTVDASEVAFASADEAMVYDAVAEMDLDGATAELLVGGYKTRGIPANTYAIGIRQAYRYGQKNFPLADLNKAEYAAKLTVEQRMAAYEAGSAAGQAQAEKAQATVAKNATTESRQGRVQFLDGGQVKDLRGHLKQRGGKLKAMQETAIGTMEKLSAAMGVNFYVFESYKKDGKRMYIDENGVERPAPSGKYRGGSGEIYIDLNAGNQGQGIMLYTVAHELTHFIREWSPAKFQTLSDILMAGYAAQGQSVQELVDSQIAKAKRNGRTIDFDTAYEEVVADSMEAVLASGNVIQMMADVKQQDQTLWQKICDWFRNLAEDLKAMVEAYKGVRPDSNEARLVAEVKGFLDTLEMIYSDALVDAGGNFQAAGEAEKNTTQEGGVKMSVREGFYSEVDSWDGKSKMTFVVGRTSEVLKDIGAKDSRIIWHSEKMARIMREHSGMTKEVIKQVPQILENPVIILASKQSDSRLVIFGTVTDANGTPVTAILELQPTNKGGQILNMQIIASAYGKDNTRGLVESSGIVYLDPNKERTKNWMQSVGLQSPSDATVLGSVGSVTYPNGKVKIESVPYSQYMQKTDEVQDKFSMRDTVEETKTLVALHNLTADKLQNAIKLGGFPMPSIAVTRYDIPHTNFGEISLVMSKDTVDPKKNRKNTVYSADAWTPTFPRTEYEANSKVEDRVRQTLQGLEKKIAPQFQGNLRRLMYGLEDLLNSYDGEENLIRHVLDNDGMKAVYLESQGKHIDEIQVEQEVPKKYNETAKAKYEAIIEALGTRDPSEIGTMPLKDIRDNYGSALEEIVPGISRTALRLSRFMQQTIDYLMDDGNEPQTEMVVDQNATRQAMEDALDREGYEAWVRELFSGIEGDKGIYNGKERFTPSGRSRSFQQTHLPVTLENIVKAMAAQNGGNTKNVAGFNGIKTLRAGTAERFKSIQGMHDMEARLQNLTEEEFTELTDALNSRLYDLIDEIDRETGRRGSDNNLIRFDMIGQFLMEASETGRYNVADIQKVFRENHHEISDELAMKVKELLFDVSQMPVNLFEAKPERAVRFDEVLAAIVPSNLDSSMVSEIQNAGMRVIQYEADNTQDRIAKVNSVENAKFSDRDSLEAVDTDSSVVDNGIINRGKGDGRVNTDSEGNALTEKQRAFFAQSKARDREGKLLVLYHGTANAGFTAFDPSKGRLGGNWFTTSRKDADTYAGNYQHKLFDPDERDEVRSAVGGSYMLGSWMRFDTEADREAFRRQYPSAETIKTDAEYEELMQKADDAGDYDEYERLEEEQLDRRNALKQIQRAYGRYEWEHSREATLQELFDNPEQFSMSDVLRAWDAYDRNNSADEDGATKEDLIEALRAIDQEGIEQGDDSIADIRFKARLPVGDSGQVVNRANNRTYAVYVNAVNPYEIDARSQTLHGADLYPTIEAGMKDGGYDSVIVRNARVGAHGETGDVVIIKDGGQVKLTSNKAPAEGGDIRFSERDPEIEKVNRVLSKENAELKYDIAYLKELLKLQRQVTGGTKFTRSSVEAAAGQLMKYANARGDKKHLAGLLNNVYEYIAGGKELTWDGVKEAAQPAVAWLQANAATRKERNSYAQDVLKEIRGSRVYLDEQQKQEVAHLYGSFNDFRKKAMGSVILTEKDAVALDTKWQEWASLWPNIFDPETVSNDMPAAMMDAFESLRSMTEVDAYGYDAELFAQDLLSQVYDSYWKVSTLRTVADAKQKEINRLKYEHTKRMANLREFHKEKTAQLKAEHQKSLKKVRQETRERAEKKLQDQAQRYQESRQKGVENRRKTEMRRKIRRTIRDLDKLLNKGDKKRNVKEGMKDLVSETLRSADVLFTEHYSNEDMIRNGVGTELTEQEAKYLNEARELMEQIANLPSGSYEAVLERQDQESKLQSKLSYRMSKLQDVFTRERARLAKAKISEVLGGLADAYKGLEDSEQGYISGAFHENVYQYLLAVKAEVGGTLVRDMSLNQLDDLYRAYTMVLTTVRNANRMFAQNLKETREVLGSRAIHEIQLAGGEHGLWFPGEDKISAFSWNNQKPIYAFERIGSETLKVLFENTRAGEDTWAKDMAEARGFYLEQVSKHRYDCWDFDQQHKFTSPTGTEFSLNLDQIMSLYAYSKREQAHDHLMKGGFVFDGNTEVQISKMGIKLTYLNKSAKAHKVSPELLGQIVGKLTAEQKAFVDEMQDYLSTTMGGKGNSISMELYGVKLFNEKHYFPLRSAGQYMERAKEADLKKQQGQISIVNSGFAKSTTPKASNPVVLSGFMDVWADHVNEMSMYHSFVLPMEDFRRVYNYASPNTETGQSVSVNSTIQEAYGEAATNYIDQLYRDLNGGAVSDPRETPAKSLMGKFKKAAVFASASVVVQQPSAIGRAFAIIDPKYFVGGRVGAKRHKALWAELKHYAPVAAIKEMGYFDTGMGKSAQDYIKGKEYKGIKEKAAAIFTDGDYRDEVLGRLPALADELTWCAIWDAAKRETKAKNPRMDVKSEEFLRKAGQRFTEVIVKTQVYDSVLSRSANMRSKGAFMSMWTAFMAEPTTTINMMEDALRKGKKGDKRYAARATGAVLGSIVLNSLLASVVYAMRDDDEDETFLEKYAQSFATEILDGINPLTYYPFLKDVWSALQGFDIERSDMSLITSLAEKATKLVQVYGKDTEGMDEEELDAHDKEIANAWWGVVDYLTALVGIPVKNVRRDINGAVSAYGTISADLTDRDTSWGSLTDKVLSEVKNNIPVIGWLPDKTAADRLYEATVGGDTAYQNRLASSYRTENSLNNAIRKGLRANDSRIWEAAAAWNENDLETYKRIAKEIVAEGNFSQDNVVAAIQAEAKAMMPQESESSSASKAKGYFTAEKFAVAIAQGNSSMAKIIQADIVDTAVMNGKTREEAEKSFASSAKSKVKELFLDGSINTDKAIGALTAYCGNTREEATDAVNKWRSEKETGIGYDEIDDAFLAGKITESKVRQMYMTYGGYSEEDATEKAAVLAFIKKHPACDGISWAAVESYTAYCETSGMKAETFWDAWKYNNTTQADVDENGESISGSKKVKVLSYINGLDLTSAQKDSLYYAFGWAESRIWEAPWH